MYKKALAVLVGLYLVLFVGILVLMGTADAAGSTVRTRSETVVCDRMEEQIGIVEYSSSARRVVDYLLLEKPEEEKKYDFPASEVEVLQRIVEAEAGGEDADGKLLVANVVLNRVANDAFPDTISEVVFQRSNGVTQFSPVASGRYDRVTVSEGSIEAVERALSGEDISQGALYFAARKYADSKNMRWFDENLTFLFRHGGHEFFK